MNFIKTSNDNSTDRSYTSFKPLSPEQRGYEYAKSPKVQDISDMSIKNITDIKTLKNGDRILDYDGNQRYVIGVHNGKIMMTGKNKHISDYKKVYTWSKDKFQQAVNERGFRLSN